MTNDGEHGFIAGLFLGATLGAMATLLLAPKSGSELRRDISEEGERLKGRAGEKAVDLKRRGQRALQETKETARRTATGIKNTARGLRERVSTSE